MAVSASVLASSWATAKTLSWAAALAFSSLGDGDRNARPNEPRFLRRDEKVGAGGLGNREKNSRDFVGNDVLGFDCIACRRAINAAGGAKRCAALDDDQDHADRL